MATTPDNAPLATRRQAFFAVRMAANAALASDRELLGRFREAMEGLFTGMAADRNGQFTRKPNIKLRLIADGLPLAKLIILPHWSTHAKTLNCGRLELELIVEEGRKTADGEEGKFRGRRLSVDVEPGWATVGRIHMTAEGRPSLPAPSSFRPVPQISAEPLPRTCADSL